MLLTAGEFTQDHGDYNMMTVAWGFIGAMWRMPVAIAPVRSTRHTLSFMERYDTWTLTALPGVYRKDLQLLGSTSGRDGDKLGRTGLTPIPSQVVAAPSYEESILTIECRTIYSDDIDPRHMVDPSLDNLYNDDYHRMYYGEILCVRVRD